MSRIRCNMAGPWSPKKIEAPKRKRKKLTRKQQSKNRVAQFKKMADALAQASDASWVGGE
jgi:hypothetical protein